MHNDKLIDGCAQSNPCSLEDQDTTPWKEVLERKEPVPLPSKNVLALMKQCVAPWLQQPLGRFYRDPPGLVKLTETAF